MKTTRPRSPIMRERLWKLAAVLPLLSALCAGVRSDVALSLRDRNAEHESTAVADSDVERDEHSANLSRGDRATEDAPKPLETIVEPENPISRNALVPRIANSFPLERDSSQVAGSPHLVM
jgi:hypothetical protein